MLLESVDRAVPGIYRRRAAERVGDRDGPTSGIGGLYGDAGVPESVPPV